MQKFVTLSSFYNFESGYSEILKVLIQDLNNHYTVIPRTYSNINADFLKYFKSDCSIDNNIIDLSLLCLNNNVNGSNTFLNMDFSRVRLLYTMWESTRINDLMIEILNNYKHIMVPCNYNKNNFIKQGLSTNIDVVPLFCDTDTFVYNAHKDRKNFVFGLSNEDPRKNLNKVIKCFLKAFKNYKDVELHIKTNTAIERFTDIKLKYLSEKISKDNLRNWYYDLDVYISGATCEGWGMMQQESMCCGRPIIFTNYGGLSEFVNDKCGFEIGYQEVYSSGYWGDVGGKWSEFNEEELVETMIYCYNNKSDVATKGLFAADKAKVFTRSNYIKNVLSIMDKYV
jgi:glycosyltransferase involved in cell wall biosynthesis